MVRIILKHDPEGVFRFASLQSPLAQEILARHQADVAALDTFYIVPNYDSDQHSEKGQHPAESLLSRSDAVHFVFMQLQGVWRLLARVMQLLPHTLRDWAYCLVARHRYRLFGRYQSCPLPSEASRSRFLDL